jgi:phosphogluconate dehydratase
MSIARHPRLLEVTARIEQRSSASRAAYLAVVQAARKPGPYRSGMGCANAAGACSPFGRDHRLQRHALGPPAL